MFKEEWKVIAKDMSERVSSTHHSISRSIALNEIRYAYCKGRLDAQADIDKRGRLLEKFKEFIDMNDSDYFRAIDQIKQWIKDYEELNG